MDTFIAQNWAQKKPLTFGNGVAAKGVFSAPDNRESQICGVVNKKGREVRPMVGGSLVRPLLSVGNINGGCDNGNADEQGQIVAHFLPPRWSCDRPWNHAPITMEYKPSAVPACQLSWKNAVAIRATPSIANTFDQYCSIFTLCSKITISQGFCNRQIVSSIYACSRDRRGLFRFPRWQYSQTQNDDDKKRKQEAQHGPQPRLAVTPFS